GRSLLGRGLLAVLAVSAIAAVAIVVIARARKDKPPAVDDSFPLPPLSSSPFLNTEAEARYVGSESCRGCHSGRDGSFRRTGMGRSMAEIDLEREPPDAAFDHVPSKRRYQVARKDGRMWHRELLLTAEPDEVVLSEHPVKYVVGSGRHSLTYLVEVDGFLVESPVTWYRSRNKGGPGWGMSPGYDVPQQEGFQRAVSEHCLICHAGQAAALGGTAHKMRVSEAAIGCERCHGPGSPHIARHQGRQREAGAAETTADQADYTIVNPGRLSRNLAEAVCQQCQLRPPAVVP